MNTNKDLDQAILMIPKIMGVAFFDVAQEKITSEKIIDDLSSDQLGILEKAFNDFYVRQDELSLSTIFKGSFNNPSEAQSFHEVKFYSNGLIYLLTKTPSNLIFGSICSGTANLGLVQMKAREFIKQIDK